MGMTLLNQIVTNKTGKVAKTFVHLQLDKKTLTAPTMNELVDWYVRKNGDEELMACRRGVIDYKFVFFL